MRKQIVVIKSSYENVRPSLLTISAYYDVI